MRFSWNFSPGFRCSLASTERREATARQVHVHATGVLFAHVRATRRGCHIVTHTKHELLLMLLVLLLFLLLLLLMMVQLLLLLLLLSMLMLQKKIKSPLHPVAATERGRA